MTVPDMWDLVYGSMILHAQDVRHVLMLAEDHDHHILILMYLCFGPVHLQG